MPLHLRGSASIRLFAILGAALIVILGKQLADRFGTPWLPYVVVPAAITLVGWSLANTVLAYDGIINVRTLFGSQSIDVHKAEGIVLHAIPARTGAQRTVASFLPKEGEEPQQFVNTMLSPGDFDKLLQWTGLPVQLAEGAVAVPAAQPTPLQPSFGWSLANLAMGAIMVMVFWFFTNR